MRTVPEQLFFLSLMIEEDEVSKQLPRHFSENFEIVSAKLGVEGRKFILAIALTRLTVLASRSLVCAVAKVDGTRCVAVLSPDIDSGMMRVLASEGIAYIKDEGNAFLPFLGMAITPT